MFLFLSFAATVLVLASKTVTGTVASNLGQISYTNNIRLLFDTDGNQVDAYGSKINNFNGRYYLYGNSFSINGTAVGLKSYSSIDLVNWVYEGFLFDPISVNPCFGSGGCGRPHIVYSEEQSTYLLWTNAGSPGYAVATSQSPSMGFTFLQARATIDPQFAALQPADFTVETFDGIHGYIVFSALNFLYPSAGSIWPPIQQTIHISELTGDFKNTTAVSYNVSSAAFDLVDQETESPDFFIRNGTYYVVSSNTCGYCNGTIGLVYRSNSIQGPWTRQIISGDSCNGQVEGVLPLSDPTTGETTYVWHSTSVPGGPRTGFGGHVFQPLAFNLDGSVEDLNCAANADFGPVTFDLGNGTAGSGNLTAATDGSPAIAEYDYVCDSTLFSLFQTWTSSKSGTLESVAVNIAAATQKIPLILTVFKFSTLADLVSPGYRYITLGTAIYDPSNLTYVFDTAIVGNMNAAVSEGDNLGIGLVPGNQGVSIYGIDFVPYCHLEYDTAVYPVGLNGGNPPGPLLQIGAGQNSYRGLDGKTSVLYERVGKGLKFFATVV